MRCGGRAGVFCVERTKVYVAWRDTVPRRCVKTRHSGVGVLSEDVRGVEMDASPILHVLYIHIPSRSTFDDSGCSTALVQLMTLRSEGDEPAVTSTQRRYCSPRSNRRRCCWFAEEGSCARGPSMWDWRSVSMAKFTVVLAPASEQPGKIPMQYFWVEVVCACVRPRRRQHWLQSTPHECWSDVCAWVDG